MNPLPGRAAATTAEPAAADRRQFSLDAVRAAAIGLVLLHHLAPSRWTSQFWVGVDLFFVLSGYLLGSILIAARGQPGYFAAFYLRRAARILPLYALLVGICAAAGAAGLPLWHYALFLQNFDWSLSGVWANEAISPTWSLAVEEQFYLMLPVLVWLLPPRWLPWALAALAATAPLCRAAAAAWFANPIAPFALMPCRMDSLFLGVLAAWAARLPRIRAGVAWGWLAFAGAVGIAGLAAMTAADWGPATPGMWLIGYSWIAGCFALGVFALSISPLASARPPWWLRPFGWLGTGAYAVYLFHMLALGAARAALGWDSPATPWLALGLTFGFAALTWTLLEAPLMRAARRHFRYGVNGGPTLESVRRR